MRVFRGLRRLLVGLGFLLLFAVCAVAGMVWLTLPADELQARIPGLSAPVSITFDADDVPRIQAANELDAAAALGFVHARDRMFQMDLMRRNASGRLSEIAGPATLPVDRLNRVLGLRRRAVADLGTLPADTLAVLDAYARGVNAWIDAKGRFSAPEFLPFGAPEPWTPTDSLLWGKIMGLYLSENWRTELGRVSLQGKLPQARIDELWPVESQGPGTPSASLPAGSGSAAALLDALPGFPGPFTLPQTASNEWAVDGRHTASGAPLLAGDPHLGYGMPGIWYLARLEWRGHVLAGATAPGVPFLVLGHNSQIAWTFTTTGPDTQDVFIETPAGDDRYATPDGPRPFTTYPERIGVRGQPDQTLLVRETRHGPLISDVRPTPNGALLAVAMANLQPRDTAASGLLALNRAADVEAAGRAAEAISAPVQNLLVADRARIALWVTGRVPIRRAGDGSAPVAGADGAHDWIGWACGNALPHSLAPASGRLVNANERIAPSDFPVFLGRDWFGDWRARRIRAMLGQSDRLTAADFAHMQADTRSAFAQQVLPALLAAPPPDDTASAQALALLRAWDGAMRRDRPEPLIFNAWIQQFRDAILEQAGVPPVSAGPSEEFVAFVLSPAGQHWCGETCGPISSAALQRAVTGLRSRFGDDVSAWSWGKAHQTVFAHPILGRLPLVGALATARIESAGDGTTVDRGATGWQGFDAVEGPSFRGVYDLADLDRSLFVVAPGQSGNLFSVHARDFLQRWRDGDTIELAAEPATISATIRLDPP
ncbi:MAG: penicillin acylase family protein [Acetobacteraceae bacterium]|nr:penicillin acylase family protein [Acetobacteraceae bacterium]